MNQHQQTDIFTSTLYIVPTPIGNLGDITKRALSVLQNVDFIAAEDTRHTGLLLQYFSIKSKLLALHNYNEKQKTDILLVKLQNGHSIALVSNAGTPLISDPGYHLVRCCRKKGIRIVPLPGACAAITALSASGLPSNRFCYEGFLPTKRRARLDSLQTLTQESRTLIFYESPHRLLKSLEDMVTTWGSQRYVVIARELTKTWESIYGAPVIELITWVREDVKRHRGEIVLIVEGYQATHKIIPEEATRTLELLLIELPLKKAVEITTKIHHVKNNALYQYGLRWQQKQNSKELIY